MVYYQVKADGEIRLPHTREPYPLVRGELYTIEEIEKLGIPYARLRRVLYRDDTYYFFGARFPYNENGIIVLQENYPA